MLSSVIAAAVLARPMPFQMSVQAWSFHRFTAFEAIEKTAQAGGKFIELFPGQQLSPTIKTGMGPGLSSEETAALWDQLKKFGVTPIAFGVVGIDKDYEKAKPLFVWAKSMGIQVINTESDNAIDTVEKLVKEFDIKVGYHNHPKQPNNPNYKVWDPAYIYNLVKDRDIRIGACADTGHWVRSGIKPVDALKTLKGRVVSSHLKDLHIFSGDGHDVPYGTGVSDIAGILASFDKTKMSGPVSVEYEYNWDSNTAEVGQCLGFVRGLYAR